MDAAGRFNLLAAFFTHWSQIGLPGRISGERGRGHDGLEPAFQSPAHERAFILRCAINASKDLLKSSHVRRTAPLEAAERVAAPAPGELHEVWQAVERLPDRERILVYLFYCEGYGLEEAAGMCGCSYAAARQRLSRARKRLRSELEVYDG